jgi:hypothetical protein
MLYLTETTYSFCVLKNKRLTIVFLLFFGLQGITPALYAQKIHLVDSVAIDFPTAASIDKTGSLYISNREGEVRKYSSFGKELTTFIPQQSSAIGSLEAWQMLRVFVFYDKSQQYIFLDRFLNASQPHFLKDLTSGFATHATIGEDNSLWLINETSLTLEKYDLRTGSQLVSTPLQLFLELDFQFFTIKTYQNKVFISMGKQGMLVFDTFGNFVQKLPLDNITYFDFCEDGLYYLNEEQIHSYDLYTFREGMMTYPSYIKPLYILVNADRIMLLTEGMIYFFRTV